MTIQAFVMTDQEARDKYYEKIRQLEALKSTFERYTENIQKKAREERKKAAKKKQSGPVIVSGATSKSDIRRLQRVLRQKIAEVITESGDAKAKEIRVNDLCRKLGELERVLIQIERAEREKEREMRKKEKKRISSVYLSGDDLTVNKSGRATLDVSVSSMNARGGVQSSSIDVVASMDAAVSAAADGAVNVEL